MAGWSEFETRFLPWCHIPPLPYIKERSIDIIKAFTANQNKKGIKY